MKFIAALSAFISIVSIAVAIPASAEGGVIAARDVGLVERGSVDVKERSLEARVDIPSGIHVIAANSTTFHDLAAATYNNPFHIGVNVRQTVTLSVNSYAAYWQVVTFSGVPGGNNIVFSGSGEGAPMQQNGQTYYEISAQTDGYLLTVLFQYSTSGSGGTLRNAVINDLPVLTVTPTGTQITVTSEDGADNDNNDSYATITLQ